MGTPHEALLRWQHDTRRGAVGMVEIIHRYLLFMREHGVPVYRSTLAITTLHPQMQALRYVWNDDVREAGPFPSPALFRRRITHIEGCTVDEAMMSYGAHDTLPYRSSPFYRLVLGEERLILPIAPGRKHEFTVMDDLALEGATEYVAFHLPAVDGQISFVTRAAGGFGSRTEFMESSLSALGMLLDAALKDLILDTVLHCYVGSSPAEQIKQGNIRPGSMMELHGAIWFSDIRNYSTHAQNIADDRFIEKLNQYYQCVVPIVYAHKGEVLKFIGDAVLAVFADSNPHDEHEACGNAYAAAQAANRALQGSGLEFDHGIGLHVGRFQFGNIGTLRRMDFTVIGNDVNIAARIEAQCSQRKARLLMSEAFVAQCGQPAVLVERTALKGITGEFALYTTPPTN